MNFEEFHINFEEFRKISKMYLPRILLNVGLGLVFILFFCEYLIYYMVLIQVSLHDHIHLIPFKNIFKNILRMYGTYHL